MTWLFFSKCFIPHTTVEDRVSPLSGGGRLVTGLVSGRPPSSAQTVDFALFTLNLRQTQTQAQANNKSILSTLSTRELSSFWKYSSNNNKLYFLLNIH